MQYFLCVLTTIFGLFIGYLAAYHLEALLTGLDCGPSCICVIPDLFGNCLQCYCLNEWFANELYINS